MLNEIQSAIVLERNNQGDYSVCWDDLNLAAAMVVLLMDSGSEDVVGNLRLEAESYREVIQKTCPSIARLLND